MSKHHETTVSEGAPPIAGPLPDLLPADAAENLAHAISNAPHQSVLWAFGCETSKTAARSTLKHFPNLMDYSELAIRALLQANSNARHILTAKKAPAENNDRLTVEAVVRLPEPLQTVNVVRFIRESAPFRNWIFLLALSDRPYAKIAFDRLRRKRDVETYVEAFCEMAVTADVNAPIPTPSFNSDQLTPLASLAEMVSESAEMENCLDEPAMMAKAILGRSIFCRYADVHVRATVEIVQKRTGRFFLREALGRANKPLSHRVTKRIRAELKAQNTSGI